MKSALVRQLVLSILAHTDSPNRILDKPEITKDMRERWLLKKPKILSALKKCQGKEICNILATVDDSAACY